MCVSVNPHWQLVVEAFQADHQSMFSGHQFVLQLGHVGLVGRLCQVVSQDVHKQVEQNQAETTQKTQQRRVCTKKINSSSASMFIRQFSESSYGFLGFNSYLTVKLLDIQSFLLKN